MKTLPSLVRVGALVCRNGGSCCRDALFVDSTGVLLLLLPPGVGFILLGVVGVVDPMLLLPVFPRLDGRVLDNALLLEDFAPFFFFASAVPEVAVLLCRTIRLLDP